MSAQIAFNNAVFVTEQMNNLMANAAKEVAIRAINQCAMEYKFDAEEAIRTLGLETLRVSTKPKNNKKIAVKREKIAKPAFPLPYNGEFNDDCCYALRHNHGLYTQCTLPRKADASFCNGCQILADKNANAKPDYGTIHDRNAVDIFAFIDPNGKAPSPYTKIMKKLKLTSQLVLDEAAKFNIDVNTRHFEEPEAKKGRPKADKPEKPKKETKKGRPSKPTKVLEIASDNEDLFASLVAQANLPLLQKVDQNHEDQNIAQLKEDKEDKEDKLAAKKAEKEAKEAAKKLQKEALALQKKTLAQQKKDAKEAAKKLEKEAKDAAKKQEKETKKTSTKNKPITPKPEDELEQEAVDTVKKIEFNGVKYFKSTNTGIVYNIEQDVVGKWINNAILFYTENELQELQEEQEEDE